MNTSDLITRYPAEWHAATHHPFLDGVRTGALPEAAFNRWLEQDFQFVLCLLRVQAQILARAPRSGHLVLAQGLAALAAELDWFENHLHTRGLTQEAALLTACREYCAFLEAVVAAPYPQGITAIWAVERAYLEAWTGVRPGAPAYREFVGHWTVPEFAAYVDALATAADEVLQALPQAGDETMGEVAQVFSAVARHEAAFWQMTFGS
jgi:thiaminase/transcriptional activator TenA